jgi:hypothetical protein
MPMKNASFLRSLLIRDEYFSALLDDERILGIYKGLLR